MKWGIEMNPEVVEKKSRKKPRVTGREILTKVEELNLEVGKLGEALSQIPTDNVFYVEAERLFKEKETELDVFLDTIYIAQK